MHATPPTPTLPATELRLVTFGSSKTILGVDQQYPAVSATRGRIGQVGRVVLSQIFICGDLQYALPLGPTVLEEGERRWQSVFRGLISPQRSFSWGCAGMWRTR